MIVVDLHAPCGSSQALAELGMFSLIDSFEKRTKDSSCVENPWPGASKVMPDALSSRDRSCFSTCIDW